MKFTLELTGEQIALISMAGQELPEKVRLALFADINAQLKPQNERIIAQAAEAERLRKNP